MILKKIIQKMSEEWNLAYCFFSDYIFYKNHRIGASFSDKDNTLARILLTMHQLEKGMSFTGTKREFGGEKAKSLCSLINNYVGKYGLNHVCEAAVNVLYEYRKRDNATKNQKILSEINMLCVKYSSAVKDDYAGVKAVVEPPVFDEHIITQFFYSRSSVRDFSNIPVTEEEYKRALSFAKTTPSACNRQTARVHFYNIKEKISQLVDNQLGNQGWCNNATACFVITSNINYFGGGTKDMKPSLMAVYMQ